MSQINSHEKDNIISTENIESNSYTNQNSGNQNNGLRIKNVIEINNIEASNGNIETTNGVSGSIPTKRKLPDWMLTTNKSSSINNEASPSKRIKSNEDKCKEEAISVESSSTPTQPLVIKMEPIDSVKEESPTQTDNKMIELKNKTEESQHATTSSITVCSSSDIKHAVKVEKADATSTSRESCKYGIRCYRRNPMHRVEQAHPGDQDYERPHYPPPPDGTPDCPYGKRCYRRNPVHFQQYNHPENTDFAKNYRKCRLRQKRNKQQHSNDTNDNLDGDNTDLDDYDLEDPFINDEESDLDYMPSNDEGDSDEID